MEELVFRETGFLGLRSCFWGFFFRFVYAFFWGMGFVEGTVSVWMCVVAGSAWFRRS